MAKLSFLDSCRIVKLTTSVFTVYLHNIEILLLMYFLPRTWYNNKPLLWAVQLIPGKAVILDSCHFDELTSVVRGSVFDFFILIKSHLHINKWDVTPKMLTKALMCLPKPSPYRRQGGLLCGNEKILNKTFSIRKQRCSR